MEGVQAVPVGDAQEPVGQEAGRLGEFGGAVWERRQAKFQGGLPGHLHFGQKQQALTGLAFQDPEEIQGIAGAQFGGVAPAPPQPCAPQEAVGPAPDGPEGVAVVPARGPAEKGQGLPDLLHRGLKANAVAQARTVPPV